MLHCFQEIMVEVWVYVENYIVLFCEIKCNLAFICFLATLRNSIMKSYTPPNFLTNYKLKTYPSQCRLKKFQTFYFDKPRSINIGLTSYWCSYPFLTFETQVKVNYFHFKFRSCLKTPLMNVCFPLSLIVHAKRIISTGKQTDF